MMLCAIPQFCFFGEKFRLDDVSGVNEGDGEREDECDANTNLQTKRKRSLIFIF